MILTFELDTDSVKVS